MDDTRLVKQAVKHIFTYRSEGDLLMDVDSKLGWQELQELAMDRATWRESVYGMRKQSMSQNWCASK